ncbi:MAG: Sua5/YciO/YrdC/YwlC family protein [Bacteroidota bacterium]
MQICKNFTPDMHPFLPPPANRALQTIGAGGLVLAPTANLWQVLSDVRKAGVLHRHLALCPPGQLNRPELLFADLDQLQEWFPGLHPKIDSLLIYHKRPCTILLPRPERIPRVLEDGQGLVGVRLIMDSFCYRLNERIDGPLLATLAMPRGSLLPTSFGKVRSDLLRSVDHVVCRRQKEVLGERAATALYLDENDEFAFVEN